jgi:anti-sigma regulatory factor (Ser/Thr protein kinase)
VNDKSKATVSQDPAQERELCRRIHHALTPAVLPSIKGLDIAALFLHSATEAGGDLFDAFPVSDDILGMYILDVTRHGLTSLLVASLMKNILSQQMNTVVSPQIVLKRVNEVLKSIQDDCSVSAFVGYLDLHVNRLTYCNAGHPSPIVHRSKERSLLPLDIHNAMLGGSLQQDFRDSTIFLHPGDRIVLVTDGIFNFLGKGDRAAGRALLETSTLNSGSASAADLLKGLRTQYEQRSDIDTLVEEDITALVIEILSQSRQEQIKQQLGFFKDDPVYLHYISYYEEMDHPAAIILKEMDTAGFTDDNIRRMKITLTELCANAIDHGNGEDHAKKVTIGHMLDSRGISVAVMDEGRGYDPAEVEDPTRTENLTKDHGRGLFIVRNYVDEFLLNERGTRVLIRKYRP